MKSKEIVSVKNLLLNANLVIPEYQRPYKWSVKNVNQLIDDILINSTKSAYRLGTIVLHDECGKLNIVDGQQRTVTILLIAKAISGNKDILSSFGKDKLDIINSPLLDIFKFESKISASNISRNFREINRRIKEFNDHDNMRVQFFYNNCELVQVILDDITEAFQFFDSQNARGKDLYPHDLLKAFHLREMQSNSNEQERVKKIEFWESLGNPEISNLFSSHLFRIRNWSKNESARYFTKNDTSLFKGITPEKNDFYPFELLHRMASNFVEEYQQSYHRNVDKNVLPFPHQIDQVIVNGKRFFEYVEKYNSMVLNIYKINYQSELSRKIFQTINTYSGRNRDGDKYVKNLFENALVYYYDKFGEKEIDRAVEHFFLWAYKLRFTLKSVYLASADNYANEEPYIFCTLRDSLSPVEVFSTEITPPSYNYKSKLEDILTLFEELGYGE